MFAVIAFGIVSLAGCSTATKTTQDTPPVSASEKTATEVRETTTNTAQTAVYTDFTQEQYSELLGKKPFAIFFHASWCPDCIFLEKQIKENIENLPPETIILKADYDTENELKQKYGITVQSTVVVIDKDGNAMPTLFGPSLDKLTSAIEKSL